MPRLRRLKVENRLFLQRVAVPLLSHFMRKKGAIRLLGFDSSAKPALDAALNLHSPCLFSKFFVGAATSQVNLEGPEVSRSLLPRDCRGIGGARRPLPAKRAVRKRLAQPVDASSARPSSDDRASVVGECRQSSLRGRFVTRRPSTSLRARYCDGPR